MQAFTILVVKRAQNFLRERLWQIGDQVGKVVEFHALDGQHEFIGRHTLDQAVANLVRQFDQHITFILRIDHFPDDGPLPKWQRFEQPRYFRRVQTANQHLRRAHAAAAELFAQQRKVGLCVFSRFHGVSPTDGRGEF